MDLILEEAQSSAMQLVRDAFIAYEHKNFEEACQVNSFPRKKLKTRIQQNGHEIINITQKIHYNFTNNRGEKNHIALECIFVNYLRVNICIFYVQSYVTVMFLQKIFCPLQLFKEVRQTAFKAFNMSTTVDSLVLTTQLKIAASYMSKSFVEGAGMAVFSRLPRDKRSEIAMTVRGYVDDLMAKVRVISNGGEGCVGKICGKRYVGTCFSWVPPPRESQAQRKKNSKQLKQSKKFSRETV